MSVKISGLVWDRYDGVGNEFVLALALADHSHDDGSHIFPSIARLATKARLSERTVQRILVAMQKRGWLLKVSNGLGGRNFTTEYKINPDWVKGDNLSPFISEQERVTPQTERVTNDDVKGDTAVSLKGDTAVSPEPSLTNTNRQESSPCARDSEVKEIPAEGKLAIRLIKLGVKITSINPTLCQWVKEKIPIELIEQCVALCRIHKPLPEGIAANYLDSVIRSELRPKKQNKSWLMSDDATMDYGNSIGVQAKVGESMDHYRQRLKDLAGEDKAA